MTIPRESIPRESIVLTVSGCIQGGATGGEFAANLLDAGEEAWNKWVEPRGGADAWATFTFPAPTTVIGYALTAAGDCPDRDPAAWEVLLDGRVIEVVRAGDGAFEARRATREFVLPVPVRGVRALTLRFKETRARNADALQLGRVRIYGAVGGGTGFLGTLAPRAPVGFGVPPPANGGAAAAGGGGGAAAGGGDAARNEAYLRGLIGVPHDAFGSGGPPPANNGAAAAGGGGGSAAGGGGAARNENDPI